MGVDNREPRRRRKNTTPTREDVAYTGLDEWLVGVSRGDQKFRAISDRAELERAKGIKKIRKGEERAKEASTIRDVNKRIGQRSEDPDYARAAAELNGFIVGTMAIHERGHLRTKLKDFSGQYLSLRIAKKLNDRIAQIPDKPRA